MTYTKKIPEHIDCGIKITAKVLGSKWKPCIIDAIRRGIMRPSQIQRELNHPGIRVINMQLRELEHHELIAKKIFPGRTLRVEYQLTPLGRSILTVLDAMDKWGDANRDKYSTPEMHDKVLEEV